MPVHEGRDYSGFFYQWGHSGKKYYFDPRDALSRQDAYESAVRQAQAVYAKGWQSP